MKIAGFFIGAIVVTSLISRATRSLELRVEKVEFDAAARRIIDKAVRSGAVRIIANEPDARDEAEYREKEREAREDNHIPRDSALFFLRLLFRMLRILRLRCGCMGRSGLGIGFCG